MDIKRARVLLVCGRAHMVQVLRTTFGLLNLKSVVVMPTAASALEALKGHPFTAVFCDSAIEDVDGLPFALAARRTPGVLNPMIPIFTLASFPNQRDVERARDEGVTDVLAQPVSAAVISRKLRGALVRPRPFIAASDFFGPDRRAGVRKPFFGDDRRRRQPKKVNIPPPSPLMN
ncbi:MAG TPA: response regulator [Rhizomicrobium sp.]|nr:response regulator [Rhizomicrobium sp.]